MSLNFKLILSLSFVFIMIISACNKSGDSTTSTPTPTPTPSGFTFKVDGNLITVDSANAIIYTSGGARTIDVYIWKGKNSGNMASEVMEMHFAARSGSQPNVLLSYYPNDTTYFNSSSSNFNLTTCDTIGNKLEGTFDFVGTSSSGLTKSITEGKIVVTKISKQ